MIAQLSKIALTDGTNSVILSNILEGVDGSASFGLTNEQDEIQIEDMQTLGIAERFTFDLRVVHSSGSELAILNNWAQNQVPVIMSGIGIDGVLLWKEPSLLLLNEEFGGKLIADQIKLTIETSRGYLNGNKSVYVGSNLLGNSNVLGRGGENYAFLMLNLANELYFIYSDNGGLLDTIGASGSASTATLICFCNAGKEGLIPYFTETSGIYQGYELESGLEAGMSGQNLTLTITDFATAGMRSPFIYFPFENQRLGGSLRVISTQNSATAGDYFVNVEFYNQSQVLISASSLVAGTLNSLTLPTRVNFTSVFTPINTKYIRFSLSFSDSEYVNGDQVTITAPFLTTKFTNNFEV